MKSVYKAPPVKLGLEGRFDVDVLDSEGNFLRGVKGNKNVVTYTGAYDIVFNQGLTQNKRVFVGTGTTEIVRSDTSLGQVLTSVVSSYSAINLRSTEVDNLDGTATITITTKQGFALGAVVGTISEVGIGRATSPNTFFAGQLIKDEFGNPTTLTILEDEQLVVTYVIEFTYPIISSNSTIAKDFATGTVTTPQGSSTYTAYSQPYFQYGDAGEADISTRFSTSTTGIYSLNSSTGGTIKNGTCAKTITGETTGTVTVKNSVTLSPTDLNSSDIAYIGLGQFSSSGLYTNLDPVSKFNNPRYQTSSYYLGHLDTVIEFSPVLQKGNTESFTFEVERTFLI